MTYALPPGWTWTSTRVDHTAEKHAKDGIEDQTTTRVVAMFDVDDPALAPMFINPPDTLRTFRVSRVHATWYHGRSYAGFELTGVEASGAALDTKGGPIAKRRGSYLAYRNEIARARKNNNQGGNLPTALVAVLDDWAAHNMPTVVVS